MLHANSTSTAGVAGKKTHKLEKGVFPADTRVSSPGKKRLPGKKVAKAFQKQPLPLATLASRGMALVQHECFPHTLGSCL